MNHLFFIKTLIKKYNPKSDRPIINNIFAPVHDIILKRQAKNSNRKS